MSILHTILRARHAPIPQHPRALRTLLEALAFQRGQKAHAVLVAGFSARPSDLRPSRDAILDGGVFDRVDWGLGCPSVRRRRDVADLRDSAEFGELVLAEVSR